MVASKPLPLKGLRADVRFLQVKARDFSRVFFDPVSLNEPASYLHHQPYHKGKTGWTRLGIRTFVQATGIFIPYDCCQERPPKVRAPLVARRGMLKDGASLVAPKIPHIVASPK